MAHKEILTIQIGHYANHVGTHFWNIQESSFQYSDNASSPREICHDVLYREGQNRARQVTFTPRLVAFDLKGSLHQLKREGVLYDIEGESEGIKWHGDVTMHKEADTDQLSYLQKLRMDKNSDSEDDDSDVIDKEDEDNEKEPKKRAQDDETQAKEAQVMDFEGDSVVWSDFLATNFHPKSVQIVEQYYHKNEHQPFDLYMCGREVFQNYEAFCDWEDRIHHFAEECDNMQGFHVLIDTHDGFGGLAESLLKYIEEEFPGKGVLTFGFTPADVADDTALTRSTKIINSALSYESASNNSSLFIPASLRTGLWPSLGPQVNFEGLVYNTKAYKTSAILATALDTMSFQYRQDGSSGDIRELTHGLNMQGRKIAALKTNLPFGLWENESLVDYFANRTYSHPTHPWLSVTPHINNKSIPWLQSVVMRGVDESRVKTDSDPRRLPHHLTGPQTRQELVYNYLAEKFPSCGVVMNCFNSAMKTSAPFPQLFDKNVTQNGWLCSGRDGEDVKVSNIPVITSVQSTPETENIIDKLHTSAAKMNINKHHRYMTGGLEVDDYTEVLENLKSLGNSYKINTESL